MPSEREDLESYGAGTLREHLSRVGIRIHSQYHLGYLHLGPASKQDLAAANVTKEEVGGLRGFCSRSFVNPGYCTLYRRRLILSQRLCLKHTPIGLQRPIYSH